MKRLITLWTSLAKELADGCGTSTTMDVKYVQGRIENEGLSFLTITLPSFGKDFQKSLDQGIVAHAAFNSFKSSRCLPHFLRGFTELVFDPGTGVLLDKPNIDAILAVRQLTLMFSKMLLPCSNTREQLAMDGFVECEKEVRLADQMRTESDISDFVRVSQLVFSDLFSKLDRDIYNGDVVPKHGPGSTAERLSSNGKYNQREWTTRLQEVFHVEDFLFPNARYFNEHYDEVDFLEPGSERPVRVISVPKTQKTPRIIAIEPTVMQYAQQGILEKITQHVKGSYLNMFIGTEDQEPNQLLAQQGSSDGSLATLDLSEASDRVSNQLVRSMLQRWPHLHKAVDACRSRSAEVPGHGRIRLAKFASMGSALCFPFEAMVFFTICLIGIERSQGHRFTSRSQVMRLAGQVRVYGDDIVIPVDHVHTVVDTLSAFGAKVGLDKSFWIGRFRESCGGDYYEGQDVSIVKVRRMFPTRQQDAQEVISLVSLRNQLYMAGHWKTTRWLDEQIERVLPHFPNVQPDSPGLGRITSFYRKYAVERRCEHLHKPLIKAYVVSSVPPRDDLDGAGALLKFFLKRGGLPAVDGRHLERSGRPRAVRIKPRWIDAY